MLNKIAQGYGSIQLSKLRRDALIVPDIVCIGDLFEKMLSEQEQMAILINEYGGFSGVLTVEDIVETIIGMEIVDEDETVANRRKLARQRWKERAQRLGIYNDTMDSIENVE